MNGDHSVHEPRHRDGHKATCAEPVATALGSRQSLRASTSCLGSTRQPQHTSLITFFCGLKTRSPVHPGIGYPSLQKLCPQPLCRFPPPGLARFLCSNQQRQTPLSKCEHCISDSAAARFGTREVAVHQALCGGVSCGRTFRHQSVTLCGNTV